MRHVDEFDVRNIVLIINFFQVRHDCLPDFGQSKRLIGNSVQIGDGPAAVTLLLSERIREPFRPLLCHWNP